MEFSDMNPANVFPVPRTKDEQDASGLEEGPIMRSNVVPVHEGRYLRYFDDCDDWAFSEFADGEWLRDGFFASDVQEAPWRGGVRPNT